MSHLAHPSFTSVDATLLCLSTPRFRPRTLDTAFEASILSPRQLPWHALRGHPRTSASDESRGAHFKRLFLQIGRGGRFLRWAHQSQPGRNWRPFVVGKLPTAQQIRAEVCNGNASTVPSPRP